MRRVNSLMSARRACLGKGRCVIIWAFPEEETLIFDIPPGCEPGGPVATLARGESDRRSAVHTGVCHRRNVRNSV